jgi:hypothetical protein
VGNNAEVAQFTKVFCHGYGIKKLWFKELQGAIFSLRIIGFPGLKSRR